MRARSSPSLIVANVAACSGMNVNAIAMPRTNITPAIHHTFVSRPTRSSSAELTANSASATASSRRGPTIG